MLKNNRQINWLPEHIRDGRFGNFLESNVDWALSRERYWGTPLPIWVCEQTGFAEAVGQLRRAARQAGRARHRSLGRGQAEKSRTVDDLKVHKPYIDAITYDSVQPGVPPGTRMRRVPDVIDCWFDSGAMPFAQWGYPHQNREKFREQFPADFISEAIDQTRGWFYSLLAISTLLFRDPEADDAPKKPGTHDWPAKAPADPVSQLHRAGADARRRRPEDVEEQAELLASRTRSSTATAPTPCAGTSSPTSRPGRRSATANRRSRTAFPSFCCGCGTSTAFS